MSKLKLTFHGGVGTVTGANFLLESDKTKILVDCGMEQGRPHLCADDPNRKPFKYNPAELNYLIVTHAHTDHIGRIPKLVKDGFRGTIYSTPTTREIVSVMLEDALAVNEREASKCNLPPIYDKKDVAHAMSLWETVPYHTNFKLGADFDLYFNDAGHILGSAIVNLKYLPDNKKVVFTGDLGNTPTPLIRNTEFVTDADYLIMESVYGDRNHEGRDLRKQKLKDILMKIIRRKGTLLIPVFSLEKTQVLLHEMNDLIESGQIPTVPVFFDSPLGIRLTEIYAKQFENFNEKVQARIKSGDDIFDFPKLIRTPDAKDSAQIHKTQGPKIIIASSGMSVGGRILEHERIYLPDPKNAILFIGYQVAGSLGRGILEKNRIVKINNQKIRVKAEVEVVNGYSSHMDSDHLIEFVEKTAGTVKKVFVVMGEPKTSMFLAQRLRDYLDVDAVHPDEGDSVEL